MLVLKKIIYIFFRIYAIPIVIFCKLKPLYDLEPFLDSFYFWTKRRVLSYCINQKENKEIPIIDINHVAIVMQGPVCYEDDFTMNTLIMYRKYYPHIPIILSTWQGLSSDMKTKCMSMNISVIENELPNNSGVGNINYQLISTRNGVKRACNIPSVQYILKTRTDQVFYRNDFLCSLISLEKTFPVHTEKLESRLIFMDCRGTYKYIPFYMNDFMLFGTKKDVANYYTTELDVREKKDCDLLPLVELRELIASKELLHNMNPYTISPNMNHIIQNSMPAEIYFVVNFYERVFGKINWEQGRLVLDKYQKFVKESCIIVDERALMHYWFKYKYKYNESNRYQEDGAMDFYSWINLCKYEKQV